jgi:DNA-binding CsgD family transcriptional regulator
MRTKELADTLDAVIMDLYEAAIAGDDWPKALSSLARSVGCAAGELESWMISQGARKCLTAKSANSVPGVLPATLTPPDATKSQSVLLERLYPHLRRAIRIGQRIGDAGQLLKALQEVADILPVGVILLDDGGRVRFMNREASRIAGHRDGLVVRPNGVSAHYPAENIRLRETIARLLHASESAPGTALSTISISRPSGRRALSVAVSGMQQHAVVLFVSDPARQSGCQAERIQVLYGLTECESRLVEALAAGVSLAGYARTASVTLHTVRGHLKNVFGKTGTHSQAQLMRLILSDTTALITVGDGDRKAAPPRPDRAESDMWGALAGARSELPRTNLRRGKVVP